MLNKITLSQSSSLPLKPVKYNAKANSFSQITFGEEIKDGYVPSFEQKIMKSSPKEFKELIDKCLEDEKKHPYENSYQKNKNELKNMANAIFSSEADQKEKFEKLLVLINKTDKHEKFYENAKEVANKALEMAKKSEDKNFIKAFGKKAKELNFVYDKVYNNYLSTYLKLSHIKPIRALSRLIFR